MINEECCKGCGLCIEVCPKNVLDFSGRFNKKGYDVVEVKDPEACINCKRCELICPDFAISVEEFENEKEATSAEG
ncbi:MAG: 4Fe-4S dicluster domain-containing protein [Candidatus Helarchaeota archaeon]